MATKNLVPRADNEGKLGLRDTTPKRRWLETNAVSGSFDYLRTDELKNLSNFDLLEAGENITIVREEDANEGWRYKISSTASGREDTVISTLSHKPSNCSRMSLARCIIRT